MDNYDKINELTQEASSLPLGDLKVKLMLEAVRHADATRDEDAMFSTRVNLFEDAGFSGHAEQGLIAFAWCVARFESDEERFGRYQHSILWFFKNILHSADELPQIPREKVEELRAQMASLYRRFGFNMRPVHNTRFIFETMTGNLQAAQESFKEYRSIKRDRMADCEACETESEVEFYDLLNQYDKAVEAAGAILAGQQNCLEIPNRTYSTVLRSFACLGRYEEADRYQKKGYRLIRDNPVFLSHVGLQIAYLTHREKVSSALKLLERHLAWAINTFELRSRYVFYIAVQRLLNRLSNDKSTGKLVLPQSFEAYEASGQYDLPKLIGWFEQETDELGRRFDARNRNNHFTTELIEHLNY